MCGNGAIFTGLIFDYSVYLISESFSSLLGRKYSFRGTGEIFFVIEHNAITLLSKPWKVLANYILYTDDVYTKIEILQDINLIAKLQ